MARIFRSDGEHSSIATMTKKKALWFPSILFLYLFAFSPSARAQPLAKLLTGYSSVSGSQAVLWIAKEAGTFRRHGLEVDLIFISSGSKMTQAVIAGELKVTQVGGTAPMAARLGGADLKIVAVTFDTLPNSIVASREIRSVRDLKGKRIGVSRFGSNTDFVARYVLKRNGLTPDRDVAILQLGDVPSIFAALKAGSVEAGVLSHPTTATAIKMGLRELLDVAETGVQFPSTSIITTESFLRNQPQMVRRYLMAVLEGIQRYKTDEAFAKKVIGEYARIQDPAVLDETYRRYAPKIPKIPYPTSGSIRQALESLSDPKAHEARPEEFYNDSILRALEREGFIDRLYR